VSHPSPTVVDDERPTRGRGQDAPVPRRYTEQQFRDAVADPEVRTMADLCRALGLVPRGANYETLRSFGDALGVALDEPLFWRGWGIDRDEFIEVARVATSPTAALRDLGLADGSGARTRLRRAYELVGLPWPRSDLDWRARAGAGAERSYTDADLLEAIEEATGYPDLCRRLGLASTTVTHRRLQAQAEALGSPLPVVWSRPGRRRNTPPFDLERLRDAVARSRDRAEVLRRLGEPVTSAGYAKLRRALETADVSTAHLDPHSWRRRPIIEYLVDGRRTNSTSLRRRLLTEGLKEHRCEACGNREWQGEPIPLELDHIDGDRSNNLLENLRLLCPNCHALTPTYRGRNIGRRPGP
jgi:hypothetical protein